MLGRRRRILDQILIGIFTTLIKHSWSVNRMIIFLLIMVGQWLLLLLPQFSLADQTEVIGRFGQISSTIMIVTIWTIAAACLIENHCPRLIIVVIVVVVVGGAINQITVVLVVWLLSSYFHHDWRFVDPIVYVNVATTV